MATTLLAGKPFVRFGAYTAEVADADPQDDFFRLMARDVAPASLPERNDAADIACIFCTSGTTNRPKIVVYDHCAYWLNGLSTLECLGLTAGGPDAGISLVRLELGAGAEPDAVPRNRPHAAYRQAVLAQPFLRLDPGPWHHVRRRRADGAEHAAEQAARHHGQGRAHPAVDDLQHRAADARAVAALRGDVRGQAVADVRHVGGRLDVRQPALCQQDGNRRAARAASGVRHRRRRGKAVPA